MATRKKAPAKKPAAKKPVKPNAALGKLLSEVEGILKEQKALNRKIKALNKRYTKVDPTKDQAAAKKIEKASTELHYLNDQAAMFSATAVGDPWEFVADVMAQIIKAGEAENYELVEELYDRIGLMESDVEIDQGEIDNWNKLSAFRTEGLMSYRQEQWVATMQWHFADVFDHLNIELPYPNASEHAYW